MMKHLKVIVLIILCAFFTVNTYSQGNISVHFGPSIPMADFGSDDMDNESASGAAIGLNVGLKYLYPLSDNGFGLFTGIDFNYNGLKQDVKDDIESVYTQMGINNPDIKYYKYINVPLTAGLNYTYQPEDKIGVFANAGLALNFFKITDMEITAFGQTGTSKIDIANSLGFKVGGGILLNPKTSISIDYFALGKHDIEGKATSSGSSEDIEGEAKVDILTFTLGIKF